MENAFQNGAFGAAPRKRRPWINITPLVDVMFLLLIFFMVSSTFRDERAIDVDLPRAEHGAETPATPHAIVITREGAWFFDETPVDEAGLERAVSRLLEEDPTAAVVLKADETADFGRVVRAIDIARDAGGSRLILPTRPLPAGE